MPEPSAFDQWATLKGDVTEVRRYIGMVRQRWVAWPSEYAKADERRHVLAAAQ